MGLELNNIVNSNSELGEKIKHIIDSGNLVDDVTIMEVVENFINNLSDINQPLLFDGIPKTIQQSEHLLSILKSNNRKAFAVFIDISEDEAVKRLMMHDDNFGLENIQNKIQNYKNETIPVIDKFYEVDRLIKIDGDQSIEDVAEEAVEKVGYLF